MKFALDEVEQKQFDEWWEAHKKAEHEGEEPYGGAIGGVVSFKVTSTSIGTAISASCGLCERKVLDEAVKHAVYEAQHGENLTRYYVNLTDYSDW